jgi:hypothetical protein
MDIMMVGVVISQNNYNKQKETIRLIVSFLTYKLF